MLKQTYKQMASNHHVSNGLYNNTPIMINSVMRNFIKCQPPEIIVTTCLSSHDRSFGAHSPCSNHHSVFQTNPSILNLIMSIAPLQIPAKKKSIKAIITAPLCQEPPRLHLQRLPKTNHTREIQFQLCW